MHKRGEWLRKPKEKVYFHCATSTLWKKSKDGFVRADRMQRVALGGFMGMGKTFLKRCCLLAWQREIQREKKWESMPTHCDDVPVDDRLHGLDDRALELCLAEAAVEFDSPYGKILPLPRVSPEKSRGGDDAQAMDPPPRQGWQAAKKKKSKWSFNPQAPDWLFEPIEGVYFHTPSKTLWREIDTCGGVWSDEDADDAKASAKPLRLRCIDSPHSRRCSMPSLSEAMRSAALRRRCFRLWAGQRLKPREGRGRVEEGLPYADPRELAERIFKDVPNGQNVMDHYLSQQPTVSPIPTSASGGDNPDKKTPGSDLKSKSDASARAMQAMHGSATNAGSSDKGTHDPKHLTGEKSETQVDRTSGVDLLAVGGMNKNGVPQDLYAKVDPKLRPSPGNALRKPVPKEKQPEIPARGCCRRRRNRPVPPTEVKSPKDKEVINLDEFPDSPRDLWDEEAPPPQARFSNQGIIGRREEDEEEEGFRRRLDFGAPENDLPMEVLRLESPEDLEVYAVPETRI